MQDPTSTPSNAKDLLEVGNGVALIIATHDPALRAAASQQGTEVLSINQDAAIDCQSNQRLRGIGGIEVVLNIRIAIHLVTQVIKRIQQWLRISCHAA